MKLISAIRIIEEREKRKRKAEKEMQRRRLPFGNEFFNVQNPNVALIQDHTIRKTWFMYSPFFHRKILLH